MPSKRSSSKKHHRRHRRRCSKAYHPGMIQGGSGAAEYAQAVYGGPGQQHAVSDSTNVIAANSQVAAAMRGGDASPNAATLKGLSPALITGGRRKKRGGDGLTSLAVPAVLLVANQMMTRRRRSSSHKRRSHRRRR